LLNSFGLSPLADNKDLVAEFEHPAVNAAQALLARWLLTSSHQSSIAVLAQRTTCSFVVPGQIEQGIP